MSASGTTTSEPVRNHGNAPRSACWSLVRSDERRGQGSSSPTTISDSGHAVLSRVLAAAVIVDRLPDWRSD